MPGAPEGGSRGLRAPSGQLAHLQRHSLRLRCLLFKTQVLADVYTGSHALLRPVLFSLTTVLFAAGYGSPVQRGRRRPAAVRVCECSVRCSACRPTSGRTAAYGRAMAALEGLLHPDYNVVPEPLNISDDVQPVCISACGKELLAVRLPDRKWGLMVTPPPHGCRAAALRALQEKALPATSACQALKDVLGLHGCSCRWCTGTAPEGWVECHVGGAAKTRDKSQRTNGLTT